jgi:hypothetical protein
MTQKESSWQGTGWLVALDSDVRARINNAPGFDRVHRSIARRDARPRPFGATAATARFAAC